MPTVSVPKKVFDEKYEKLSQEEVDVRCFDFGIELDDVTTEKAVIRKEKHLEDQDAGEDEEVIYKIAVPANRYDLLCTEGIIRALRSFTFSEEVPNFTLSTVHITVKSEKPYVTCAILRSITFDETSLASYISLEKKLNRKRELVEVTSHDLDALEASITNGVLSLPVPHSPVSLKTKNIFIECTATDLTRASTMLNTMVTIFSELCENKYEIEPVDVVYKDNKCTYPDLSMRTMEVDLSYVKSAIGVDIGAEQAVKLLGRMQLPTKSLGDKLFVSIPPSRSDILHPCDVMEDVATAYGVNNIPETLPSCHTVGTQQPINELGDLIREEMAMAGFVEVCNFMLLSKAENTEMLNREHDDDAVVVSNPRSSEFETLRTSLLPSLLKVMKHSKGVPRPVKIFEVGDIVRLDSTKHVGATNRRHLAALYCDVTSAASLETIHGTLDRIMNALSSPFCNRPTHEPEFMEGRQAAVWYNDTTYVGKFGILHPKVLKNFDIPDPCAFLELDIEHFL